MAAGCDAFVDLGDLLCAPFGYGRKKWNVCLEPWWVHRKKKKNKTQGCLLLYSLLWAAAWSVEWKITCESVTKQEVKAKALLIKIEIAFVKIHFPLSGVKPAFLVKNAVSTANTRLTNLMVKSLWWTGVSDTGQEYRRVTLALCCVHGILHLVFGFRIYLNTCLEIKDVCTALSGELLKILL